MADGCELGMKAAGWKSIQIVLLLSSGGLLLSLGKEQSAFFTNGELIFIYCVEVITLLSVLILMILFLFKMATPNSMVILLAIIGTAFWTSAAALVFKSFEKKSIDPNVISNFLPTDNGLIKHLFKSVISYFTKDEEMKHFKLKLLSLGIFSILNALSFFAEAILLSLWKCYPFGMQRGKDNESFYLLGKRSHGYKVIV